MIDKSKRTWMLGIVVLVAMLTTLALAACGGGAAQPAQPTQPSQATAAPATADGAQLLDQRCSTCHSADRPKSVRKTAAEWEQTVTLMMQHGAQLTAAEKKVLVDYLATNYGK
jgi:cytochrome c5